MDLFRTWSAARAQAAARKIGRERVRAMRTQGPFPERFAFAVASSLYSGLLPKGGLYGAIAGSLLAAAMPSAMVSLTVLGVVVVAGTFAIAIVLRASGTEDPSEVTIDEVAGAWMSCLLSGLSGWGLILPFCLFCVFDATKPWPSNLLDRHPGAVGVMGDDLVAGAYGGLLSHASAALWTIVLPITTGALAVAADALRRMAIG